MAFQSHISDTCEKVSLTYSHPQTLPALNRAITLYMMDVPQWEKKAIIN